MHRESLVKRDASQHPPDVLRWFAEAGREYSDGASFNNFLVKIRRASVSTVPPQELASLQPVLDSWIEPLPKLRVSKKKRSFVQEWKMADILPDLDEVGHGRNFAQGQDAAFAVQCLMCHRMGEEGGSVGPELTAVASRFSRKYILESILEPSKVISEQYANTDIGLKNGDTVSGRVVSETADKIMVRPSMLAPDMQEISKADIKSRELSKTSPMPPRPREYPDKAGDPRPACLPRSRRPPGRRAVQEMTGAATSRSPSAVPPS